MKLKRSLKYMVLVVLTGSLTFLFGFTTHRNMEREILATSVDFEHNKAHFLSVAMVNKLLIQNQKSVQNQPKSKLDLYRLENRVLSNPYVESASVYVSINGELFASIKERTPIARVLTENESYYLDKKGVKIPLSQNYAARVPLVTGVTKADKMEEIQKFMRFIYDDDFLKKEVIGVHKMPSGDYHLTVRSGNYRIDFGTLQDTERKFKKLKAFYSKTLTDKTIDKYKTINLKFHNQVVGIK